MTRDERLAILGPQTIANIHRDLESAPPPDQQLIELLRRIFSPTGTTVVPQKQAAA